MAFMLTLRSTSKLRNQHAELLSRAAALPVLPAKNGTLLRPNYLYVIPAAHRVRLVSGNLKLTRSASASSQPVKGLLVSLAAEMPSRAIGVLLDHQSGGGLAGLKKIKRSGGITFLAKVAATRALLKRPSATPDFVDFILPPEKIARELGKIGRKVLAANRRAEKLPSAPPPDIAAHHAPVLVWLSNKDNLRTWFNQPWLDFTGKTLEQEYGQGWQRGIHPDDVAHWKSTQRSVFAARQSYKVEYRLRRHDGEYRWLLVHGVPRYEGGKFIGYIGSCVDITERKTVERQLTQLLVQKEAQARLFDATLSSITDLAYTFDLEGNWIYANKPLLELWGKTLAEITGKSSLQLNYPPDLARRLKAQVKEVVASGKAVRGETYFKDARGVDDFHEYIFSPVFDADGKVTAVCGTTRLTTDRKRAEAAAESYRRVLQLIAEDVPLRDVLSELVVKVEGESSGKSFASVLLLEPDGIHLRHGASSSLPAAYAAAIDGVAIGQGVGSCGTAAFLKAPVYVADIAKDPLWVDYKDLALANGLKSCWSVPILTRQGEVLGTFAVYHADSRQPSRQDSELVEAAARLASIAIERKQSDAAMRESQRRYSQLVNALPTAVYTTDHEGRVMLFNEAATMLWGRTPEIGQDFWCGSHRLYRADGSPLPLELSPAARTLKQGKAIRGEEIVIERPDGSRRNVMPYPDPIHDATGRVVGAVNMLLDITESKRAEEAARRLAALVESSDDAIISKSLEGIITTWNQGATELFGYEAQEVIGKPVTILMPPELVATEQEILRRIRQGEGLESHATVRRRKDGSLVDVSLTVSPIKDSSGKVIGASKIVRDITTQKQAERRLERAHQEALAASRAKDEFLAALSHELRTPLNPVLLLASEGAEDPTLAPEVKKSFITIRNNVELEARLIDDLLDITRIIHGKLAMTMGVVDVHEVLQDAVGKVKPEMERKGIIFSCVLKGDPSTVTGDTVRLQQIFWNVLANAVKFTPEKGTISIATRNGKPGHMAIEIADSGIGMTKAELGKIFEAFAQGEHGSAGGSHRFGGLGLGLAITRKLVEAHAGTIEACSAGPNKGSIFVVTLPIAKAAPGQTEAPSARKTSHAVSIKGHHGPIRVLLVEDHEPTRTALAHLLKRRHYEVKTAGSVAEARTLAGSHQFHLLISDIGLPDGSGMDLMIELQKAQPKIKGLALTGYGMEDDITKGQAAGFQSYLTKPIRMQSLESALAELFAS